MKNEKKIKEQLIKELQVLRKRLGDLEESEADYARAKEALSQSQNKLMTLLGSVPQMIFSKNTDSVYLSCNDNYARSLKVPPDEIQGKTDYDFFPKELAEKHIAEDERIIFSGKTKGIEEKYLLEGKEVWTQTVRRPVKDEEGNITGVMGVSWDITEKKRQKQALIEKQLELENKTKAVQEMFASLQGLLKKGDEGNTELGENALLKVKKLVMPCLEKLKDKPLKFKLTDDLNMLRSFLDEIL